MPVLDIVGPSTGRGAVSAAAAPAIPGNAALRRFGALPMPSLEWNAEVERDTAHLYERIKTSCRRSSGRSSRHTSARSTP